MNLIKVYYSHANIVDTSLPFVCEATIDGKSNIFTVKIPHNILLVQLDKTKDMIQNHLYDEVANFLQRQDFFLIPSRHEVELEAWFASQHHHPELHPMSSDESIGGLLGSQGREES